VSVFLKSSYCPACGTNEIHHHYPGFGVCRLERECGLIWATDRITTQTYDAAYVAERYDKYPTTQLMSELRASLVETVLLLHDSLPRASQKVNKGALLDVGYGNGSFIREASQRGWRAAGSDVNPTPYPGVERRGLPLHCTQRELAYQVITFWDCLEHFEELDQVREIANATEWIVLSFPNPPEDFPIHPDTWKHYRPGEHHFYFTPQSLAHIFTTKQTVAEVVYTGNPEDCIRGRGQGGSPNILTVALRMRNRC
jgi:hypothetical protein